MSDDFFAKDTPKGDTKMDTATPQPEVVKLGDREYSQDELNRLVGLGQTAAEIEKNYGKLDKMVSDYGRRADEIGRLKKEMEELRNKTLAQKQEEGQHLSPEELKQVARQQAKELGLMTQEDFDSLYVTRRAAERLVEDVDGLLNEVKSKGQPETTKEALLKHMQETGIRNPQKAYKDMFEAELDAWKEQQTKKAVMPGVFSTQSSTAGAKTPPEVKITRENLDQLLHEALSGGGQ